MLISIPICIITIDKHIHSIIYLDGIRGGNNYTHKNRRVTLIENVKAPSFDYRVSLFELQGFSEYVVKNALFY